MKERTREMLLRRQWQLNRRESITLLMNCLKPSMVRQQEVMPFYHKEWRL